MLKVKTNNDILRDLEAIFAYAVQRRVAGRNPIARVERVKTGSEELVKGEHGTRTDKTVEPDKVLSAAECAAVTEAAAGGFVMRPVRALC